MSNTEINRTFALATKEYLIENRFKVPGKKSSEDILDENKENCSSEYKMLLKSFIDLCYVNKSKKYVDE